MNSFYNQIKYIVTTNLEDIPLDLQVFMVDGTVPSWIPKQFDYCWDHHRSGGADIQIDEIPFPDENCSLLKSYAIESKSYRVNHKSEIKVSQAIVTAQFDADACCSSAFLHLDGELLKRTHNLAFVSDKKFSSLDCLRAISYNCDHLGVPSDLSDLAYFAEQAVASLAVTGNDLRRSMGLPQDKKLWTDKQFLDYGSYLFEIGTKWLIDASSGICSYPGELNEAIDAGYWQQIEADKLMLYESGRINILDGFATCDWQGLGKDMNIRAFVRAINEFIMPNESIKPQTLIIMDHKNDGHRYRLSCISNHPHFEDFDYTVGTLQRLSEAEYQKAGSKNINYNWGGRRTVAGSTRLAPSLLSLDEVIKLI